MKEDHGDGWQKKKKSRPADCRNGGVGTGCDSWANIESVTRTEICGEEAGGNKLSYTR